MRRSLVKMNVKFTKKSTGIRTNYFPIKCKIIVIRLLQNNIDEYYVIFLEKWIFDH
jgi:hypothetical protein